MKSEMARWPGCALSWSPGNSARPNGEKLARTIAVIRARIWAIWHMETGRAAAARIDSDISGGTCRFAPPPFG